MAAENETIVQNLELAAAPPRSAASSIKSILFHVYDDGSLSERLQLVLSIARTCGAHIHCLHVTPIEAYEVVDAFATFVNREIVSALQAQDATLRQLVGRALNDEDVTWDYEQLTGEIVPRLVQRAALADIVITGREPQAREFGGPPVALIGDLLAQIRTPLFVTGDRLIEWDPFGSAVIAWNGSYEAANAVRASLSLLKLASRVQIVQIHEREEGQFPSTDVLKYLSRHDIEAELDCRTAPEAVDEALVEYARSVDAGIIVMGGYSHSRAGEFLFGGVTRALLKKSPIALVMAR